MWINFCVKRNSEMNYIFSDLKDRALCLHIDPENCEWCFSARSVDPVTYAGTPAKAGNGNRRSMPPCSF